MAIIQMWPQNQGLRNSISFNGRIYSSIPGVSIPVPDFDVAILQANGWTTDLTIAGKTTITMLPPANSTHNQLTINGRTYITTPGIPIEVQPFDAPILQANGWFLFQVTIVTLQTLTLSAATFHVGDPQGTIVGTIQNSAPGSTIAFGTGGNALSTAGALQISDTILQVGPTPPGVTGNVTFGLVETLAGATNTPNQSNGFSVSELQAIPVNTGIPTISGTAQVGQTLTTTNGTWTNAPTSFSFQWKGNGTNISGATASTYVPVASDIGNTLTVAVVAINGSGSSTPATSAATSSVIDIIPANSSIPTISGIAQVGQTLTATTGTWTHNPTSFATQWNRAGTPIGGATASTYAPVVADIGSTLTVSVIATNSGGSSTPATSAATAPVTASGSAPTLIVNLDMTAGTLPLAA